MMKMRWWRSGPWNPFLRPMKVASFPSQTLKSIVTIEVHSVLVFQFELHHSIFFSNGQNRGQWRSGPNREGEFSIQEELKGKLGRDFADDSFIHFPFQSKRSYIWIISPIWAWVTLWTLRVAKTPLLRRREPSFLTVPFPSLFTEQK